MATKQIIIRRRNYSKAIKSYAMVSVFLAIIASVFGFTQFQTLLSTQDALAKEQEQITALQGVVNQSATNLQAANKDSDKFFAELNDKVQKVFPVGEEYTVLTRTLDKFLNNNNTSSNKLFASDLKFSQSQSDADKDYSVLPFSMTINTSKNNFQKFMQYIENSGALDNDVRLMDIQAISINFTNNESSSASGDNSPMNLSVSLNAYFQKSHSAIPAK